MTEVAALGLRVSGVTDIDSASSSLDRFTKSSKSADQASGRLTTESRNTSKSLADVAREGDKSSASISKLAGAAKLAAGAFAGIKLTTLISDITMANSRFEQLGLVMGVVGRNASLSQDQVNAYAREVEAMGISMTESRQTIIRMTQAQMDLSKASELARLAQDAAVIANTNSSDALGRLIYGLQSGQVEILRNMGLNVNFAASYSKLAAEMGVTVDQLSEVDKVQARTNAVMEAGIGIAGAYDASMENAGKQLGSTTRYLQDLGVMWGEVFSDAARDAIFGYSDALKALHASSKELRDDGTLAAWSKNLADAAALLAIAIGSRLVAAVGASAVSFAAATIESTRYQMALARMAGVSTTTAARLTALSVAARGASAAMALVGGPAGAALLAAGAIYYFATRASEAEREAEALDRRIAKLGGTFNNLNADQAAAAILDYDTKLASAERTMRTAEARVETLQRYLREFPNSSAAKEWAADLVRARGAVSDAADEVRLINDKLSQLRDIVNAGSGKKLADDAEEASEAFTKLNAQLSERLALVGLNNEADRLAARIREGYVDGLKDGEGELLVALQRRIDAALEADNASRAAAAAAKQHQEAVKSAFDGAVDGYHRQLNLAQDATEAEKLLYEVQHGRLQGLLPAQVKMLEGMARELDMRNKLAQAEADQKGINRERDDIARQLMTEEEAILTSYARRKSIVEAATFENEQARTDLLLRLEEERNEALIEANGSYWERWLMAAEESMLSFDDLSKTVVDNFTTSFGNAFESMILDSENLGDAMRNMAQGMVRAVVNAIGQMIAQWLAYQAVQMLVGKTTQTGAVAAMAANAEATSLQAGLAAFASTAAIPIVGPAAAPAAMAAALGVTQPMVGAVAASASAGLAGFQRGGYTGSMGVNEVAGVVHGREYVFDAASTARIGVDNLEAMRTGKALPSAGAIPSTSGSTQPAPSPVVVNLFEDSSRGGDVEQRQREDGSMEVNVFVADIMSDGPRARAIQQAFGLRRQGR